jgi:poly(3-hydroxybutyrate) depolymerase
MDADYYLETIRTVFQDFLLVEGTWDVKAADGAVERVKPQDIRGTAMLTVEGELDDISGSGQTEAAHELCTGIDDGKREHYEVKGAGHYGIFSGRRWRELVYPKVQKFIAANDAPQSRAGEALPADETLLAAEDAKPVTAAAPAAKKVAAKKVVARKAVAKAAVAAPVAAPVAATKKKPATRKKAGASAAR